MKTFEKPSYEVVWFDGGVLSTSGCGCYDEFIPDAKDCLGDTAYCTCTVNHNPAEANCTPCPNAYTGPGA